MDKRTCCFTGCRIKDFPIGPDDEIQKKMVDLLRKEIKRLLIKEQVYHFITGMTLGSDLICAGLILELRDKYPRISLECAVPYEEQAVHWTVPQREVYYDTLAACDKLTQLQTAYTRDCLKKHTQYMIDKSRYVLAVWDGTWCSKTGRVILSARKKNREVITIDSRTLQITRTKRTETGKG